MRQQLYLEVIRNHDQGLFPDYKQCCVADKDPDRVCERDHIVNPPTAGSLANWKCTCSHPEAS